MDKITKILNDLSPGKTVFIGVTTGLILFIAESCISCLVKKIWPGTDDKPEDTARRESPETEYINGIVDNKIEMQTNLKQIKDIYWSVSLHVTFPIVCSKILIRLF